MSDPGFAAVLSSVAATEGWLTAAQAQRLYERARALGAGARIVEIGSFRGRSTIVLASGAADGVEVVAIDPHAGGDRGPGEIAPDRKVGEADSRAFMDNLASAGVTDRVRYVRERSDAAHSAIAGDIDLLFIDGAHRLGPARADISGWGERVSGGGIMSIHDAFSSIGVTGALFSTIVFSPRWRYLGRSGSLAEYRRERLGPGARVWSTTRQLLQLPWFVRNVVIKVLLVAKLRPLTRLLGHGSDEWPH